MATCHKYYTYYSISACYTHILAHTICLALVYGDEIVALVNRI